MAIVTIKVEGAADLERNLIAFESKLSKRAIRKGLRAARQTIRNSVREASKSKRVSRYTRFGSLTKGKYLTAITSVGVRGYGGATGLGPSDDKRAWFTAYSFEKGNPSPRNWTPKHGGAPRTQAPSPFIEKAANKASDRAVADFSRVVKQDLGI